MSHKSCDKSHDIAEECSAWYTGAQPALPGQPKPLLNINPTHPRVLPSQLGSFKPFILSRIDSVQYFAVKVTSKCWNSSYTALFAEYNLDTLGDARQSSSYCLNYM